MSPWKYRVFMLINHTFRDALHSGGETLELSIHITRSSPKNLLRVNWSDQQIYTYIHTHPHTLMHRFVTIFTAR